MPSFLVHTHFRPRPEPGTEPLFGVGLVPVGSDWFGWFGSGEFLLVWVALRSTGRPITESPFRLFS